MIGAVARVFATSSVDMLVLGTQTVIQGGVPSIFNAPSLVAPATTVATIVLLPVMARAVVESRDADIAFAEVLCALVIVTLLVWQHYLSLLVWPLWVLARRLNTAGWPRLQTAVFFLVVELTLLPLDVVRVLAVSASNIWSPAGVLTLLALPAGPMILFWLLVGAARDDRRSHEAGEPDDGEHQGHEAPLVGRVVL